MEIIINLYLAIIYKLLNKKIIMINVASGLGDYLWIRNLLHLLKNDDKYKNYKIVLVCTNRWIDFAKTLDKKYVNAFISIRNPDPKNGELKKTEKIMLKIWNTSVFINYAPYKAITKEIYAEKTYTLGQEYQKLYYRERSNKFINQITKLPSNFSHKLPVKRSKHLYNTQYVIIVLGGYAHGQFDSKQIKKLIEKILNVNETQILLLGMKKDLQLYKNILNSRSEDNKKHIINGCKTYKTWELPDIINRSKLVITPNTSVYNMCIQLNKNCICASTNEINTIDYNNKNIRHILDNNVENYIQNNNQESFIPLKQKPLLKDLDIERFNEYIDEFLKQKD